MLLNPFPVDEIYNKWCAAKGNKVKSSNMLKPNNVYILVCMVSAGENDFQEVKLEKDVR